MIITEAGRKAKQEQDRNIASIKREILQALHNDIKFTHKQLFARYHTALQTEVKEAMWQLIGEGKIQISQDHQLILK